jgi:hypothetical protein
MYQDQRIFTLFCYICFLKISKKSFWHYKLEQTNNIFTCGIYGGWFGTLIVALSIATAQPISLSPFRLVASDNTTKRKTVRCCAVVLSLANHVKRRVVVRRLSRCRPVAWLINQPFDLNRATVWHRNNTPHETAPFFARYVADMNSN